MVQPSDNKFAIALYLQIRLSYLQIVTQLEQDEKVENYFGSREADRSNQIHFYSELLQLYSRYEVFDPDKPNVSLNYLNVKSNIFKTVFENIDILCGRKFHKTYSWVDKDLIFGLTDLFALLCMFDDVDYIDRSNQSKTNYDTFWSRSLFPVSIKTALRATFEPYHFDNSIQEILASLIVSIDEKTSDINHSNIFYKEHKVLSNLVKIFVPHYEHINAQISFQIQDLNDCQAGKKGWQEFENICFNILNFCFRPELDRVYAQVRTENNFERRDFILPVNHSIGFYNTIFHEYECKNIIVEVKNKNSKFSKDVINQLRIYLSKPTIGKFGILIIRDKRSYPNLSLAIRQAYSDDRQLILVFDDDDLKEMVKYKLLFGNIYGYLHYHKTKFELDY